MPVALEALDMQTCDDQTNNGKESFDLNLQNATILGTQNALTYSVTYHSSFSNANTGNNALGIPYENNTNPQTIYATVTNNLTPTCYAVSDFDLNVLEKPLLNMKDIYSICEGFTVPVNAPSGFSSYLWSTGATTQSITIDEPGNYSVTVTKDYGNIICESSQDFTVFNSNKATITSIITNDWTQRDNTITVMVSGEGIYEYSLNGIDFQDDNHFSRLTSGDYIVYVRDKKGCGTVKEEISLLSYPKFFTPNGDGYNDYWQINFSKQEPNMKISIFDRYGKLITTFNGSSNGWDGTYNGTLPPSTDYWFLIVRENGKEYKGHFSLKR
jgi:gliding motility-associated-like protein